MHPVLFRIGHLTIYSYGVLVAAGVLLGLFYAWRAAPAVGVQPDRIWNLGVYMVLAGLVGSKLWLIALYAGYYWSHPRALLELSTLQSGGVFYGGLIGAALVWLAYTRVQKLPTLLCADLFFTALALGHAVGRLGCFAAGCCWGKPTWLPWGVTFHDATALVMVGTPLGIPLHPTQLYESAAEFANFLFLAWLLRRRSFPGQAAAAFLVLYGFERGVIEFFRGDPDRTPLFHGTVSLMQIVSLAMIALGAWFWWRGRVRAGSVAKTHAPAPAKH